METSGDGAVGDGSTSDRSAPVLVLSGKNIVYIGAGKYGSHSLAVESSGSMWSWGDNGLPFPSSNFIFFF